MDAQHYVYGQFRRPEQVARAVEALINADFEPQEIDAFAVHGGELKRLSLVHRRPLLAGTTLGIAVGVAIGLVFGLTLAPRWIPPDVMTPVQWALMGAVSGGFTGLIWGSVFWNTRVAIRRSDAGLERFFVGMAVPEGRTSQVQEVLGRCTAISMGEYPLTANQTLEQHVARHVSMGA